MSVIAFNAEVTKGQLKNYADVICFSQVGLAPGDIAGRLDLPEHLVSAWIDNWHYVEYQVFRA